MWKTRHTKKTRASHGVILSQNVVEKIRTEFLKSSWKTLPHIGIKHIKRKALKIKLETFISPI